MWLFLLLVVFWVALGLFLLICVGSNGRFCFVVQFRVGGGDLLGVTLEI